jgi:hypothetical protein
VLSWTGTSEKLGLLSLPPLRPGEFNLIGLDMIPLTTFNHYCWFPSRPLTFGMEGNTWLAGAVKRASQVVCFESVVSFDSL